MSFMKQFTLVTAAALFALVLAGCGPAPQQQQATKPAEEQPAEPIDGRDALFKMYAVARGQLGLDAQVLKMNGIALEGVKPERGKAAAWEAVFVSPSKSSARSYTYSVIEGQGNLHKGVFAGPDQGWSGARPNAQPIPMAGVKVDTVTAYKTALGKAADYEKKNPNKPISFLLERTDQFPDPVWRVIWGESAGTSNFSVVIDAATGNYLQTLR